MSRNEHPQSPEHGRQLLASAAQRGDIHEVRLLLLEGHDPNVPQDNGMTALHWSSFHGAKDMAVAIMDAEPDVNAQDVLGNTPLHYAAGALPPEDALEEVKRAAQEGLPTAQASLGKMYVTGDGMPQDAATGLSWYLKSAKAGDSASQFVVGVAYASGHGMPRDNRRARYWLQQAAAQGHEEAQTVLG